MALSLVYGFFVFFIEAPGKKRAMGQSSKLESLNKFITHVAELTKESLSEIDSYIIEKAPKQWDKDPLLSSDSKFQFKAENTEADVSALKVNIKYTGYLNMGAKNSHHEQKWCSIFSNFFNPFQFRLLLFLSPFQLTHTIL